MLKKSITYTDFNGDTQTEDLYFNLSRTELTEMLELKPRLEAWTASVAGEPRELTTEEVTELLSIIKMLVEKSYGIRSADGKRFSKSRAIFADFQETAAYDEFVFSLFGADGAAAQEFLTGVLPADVFAEATETVELPQPAIEDARPAWIREDREPTKAELASMNPQQLRELYARKNAVR